MRFSAPLLRTCSVKGFVGQNPPNGLNGLGPDWHSISNSWDILIASSLYFVLVSTCSTVKDAPISTSGKISVFVSVQEITTITRLALPIRRSDKLAKPPTRIPFSDTLISPERY